LLDVHESYDYVRDAKEVDEVVLDED